MLTKCSLSRNVFFRGYQTTLKYKMSNVAYTSDLVFINDSIKSTIPSYALLDIHGSPRIENIKVDIDLVIKMYTTMMSLNIMDTILYEAQRQGRISFYMTSYGEEAVQVGSAAALNIEDLVYTQYRESGILLWRGFNFLEFINQCYGNIHDKNRGRQMPIHYGSKKYNFMTISSPLCTQLPQAVGAAYGIKKLRKKSCIACYFGEGAASEGDAHAAFNFAAILKCPIILICRNNGYAISTPNKQQYNGDGIAAKGLAHGIQTIRVDGNDIIAMYKATNFARSYAIEKQEAVLIEAITYRIGHHSTSDDSGAYRSKEEVNLHLNTTPIIRLKNYLEKLNLWNEEKEETLIYRTKTRILREIIVAEKERKPHWKELFSDVYYKMPIQLRKQMKNLENHLSKHSRKYSPFT